MRSSKRLAILFAVLITVVSAFGVSWFQHAGPAEGPRCRPPLPMLAFKEQVSENHSAIVAAVKSVDKALGSFYNKGGIDSITVAVVTPFGSIYEAFWGSIRANETMESERGTPDRNTIYRLASISKLFTAMETYILRDRAGINMWVAYDSLYRMKP